MESSLEQRCQAHGVKMTDQRRVIARVLSEADDHPDVEEVYQRATARDPRISLATVYRAMRLFEQERMVDRLDFGDGRARFEEAKQEDHHHLIDVDNGEIVEFTDKNLDALKQAIADRLGYEVVDCRFELFARRKKP